MYPGRHAVQNSHKPAFIMAATEETVTYAELEQRSNRLAHLLRGQGLKRLDHFSVFMENNHRFIESCVAGERTGLYYTCINSFLTAQEVAYIVNNSESQVMVTSASRLAVAQKALLDCPRVKLCLVVDADSALPASDSNSGWSGVIFPKPWPVSPVRPSVMSRWAMPCSIRRGPRGAPRGCSGLWKTSRPVR